MAGKACLARQSLPLLYEAALPDTGLSADVQSSPMSVGLTIGQHRLELAYLSITAHKWFHCALRFWSAETPRANQLGKTLDGHQVSIGKLEFLSHGSMD